MTMQLLLLLLLLLLLPRPVIISLLLWCSERATSWPSVGCLVSDRANTH